MIGCESVANIRDMIGRWFAGVVREESLQSRERMLIVGEGIEA